MLAHIWIAMAHLRTVTPPPLHAAGCGAEFLFLVSGNLGERCAALTAMIATVYGTYCRSYDFLRLFSGYVPLAKRLDGVDGNIRKMCNFRIAHTVLPKAENLILLLLRHACLLDR